MGLRSFVFEIKFLIALAATRSMLELIMTPQINDFFHVIVSETF